MMSVKNHVGRINTLINQGKDSCAAHQLLDSKCPCVFSALAAYSNTSYIMFLANGFWGHRSGCETHPARLCGLYKLAFCLADRFSPD